MRSTAGYARRSNFVNAFRERPLAAHKRAPTRIVKPTDELSAAARAILGTNGVERFEEFRSYPEGWDFGHGQPLSSASIASLDLFLVLFGDFPNRPSLFLTRSGNLELAWEDAHGRIELEFFPNKVQYFFEVDGVEGEVPISQTMRLIAQLRDGDTSSR